MKARVENIVEKGKVSHECIARDQDCEAFNKWTDAFTRQDHPTVIQILLESDKDKDMTGNVMPNLIYVSREKSRTSPHHFKAGALNVLRLFEINPMGMDGLLGPIHLGTGCFFNRRVFFGGPSSFVPPEILELSPGNIVNKPIQSQPILAMAHRVASCNYENQSKWGSKMGFRYGSLVEDYYTGYRLKCEGWRSIFCHPDRAAFYGNAPINLIDVLNQNKRWAIGLLEVGFSKYNPITFGSQAMGPLMGLAYAYSGYWAMWSIPITIYAFIPQLALLNGVTIFPKDFLDFLLVGGTVQSWWNDQRMWMIRGPSCYLFGLIEYLLKSIGISKEADKSN
uniref:Cellulose synthase-like protein G3 n=1 Tax=Fagus sylvatica TaxID=28930 RepID=A0A2N9FEB8_FAGSY